MSQDRGEGGVLKVEIEIAIGDFLGLIFGNLIFQELKFFRTYFLYLREINYYYYYYYYYFCINKVIYINTLVSLFNRSMAII